MANKKTNKKVTNKKQSSGKRNSAGSKSIANYADTIRVTEIVSVAVSVILFCQATVFGMLCIMYMSVSSVCLPV